MRLTRLLTSDNPSLLTQFLNSRRQGISKQTIRFYQICLTSFLKNYPLTPQGINKFLADLKCGNAKHAYYRAIKALCNWGEKEGYIKDNPIKRIDAPKVSKQILPSLTSEQVNLFYYELTYIPKFVQWCLLPLRERLAVCNFSRGQVKSGVP